MSHDIEFPSPRQAEKLSDEFDRQVRETLAELRAAGRRVRADVILRERGAGESSPVRLAASLFVTHEVETDPDVTVYDDPSEDELRAILAKAEGYTGDWFHSRVVLHYTGEWSALQREVADLDEESGVFLMFHYPTSQALYSHLESVQGELEGPGITSE